MLPIKFSNRMLDELYDLLRTLEGAMHPLILGIAYWYDVTM